MSYLVVKKREEATDNNVNDYNVIVAWDYPLQPFCKIQLSFVKKSFRRTVFVKSTNIEPNKMCKWILILAFAL